MFISVCNNAKANKTICVSSRKGYSPGLVEEPTAYKEELPGSIPARVKKIPLLSPYAGWM